MKAPKFPMAITSARTRVRHEPVVNVEVGTHVQRLPCGVICRVTDVTATRIRIRQPGRWTGWVTKRRFANHWKVV